MDRERLEVSDSELPVNFLDSFYDPKADYPDDWSIEDIVLEEIHRLVEFGYIAHRASERGRRLGGDATRAELSSDKKRSRRIAHVCRTAERAWQTEFKTSGVSVVPCSDERKRELNALAGRLDWAAEIHTRNIALVNRATLVVSWAKDWQIPVVKRFANRALNRYLSEIERMSWAVR